MILLFRSDQPETMHDVGRSRVVMGYLRVCLLGLCELLLEKEAVCHAYRVA
ncbi:MAG: hypothetical protein ACYS5W_07765 [Planctomycetota bacterium]